MHDGMEQVLFSVHEPLLVSSLILTGSSSKLFDILTSGFVIIASWNKLWGIYMLSCPNSVGHF